MTPLWHHETTFSQNSSSPKDSALETLSQILAQPSAIIDPHLLFASYQTENPTKHRMSKIDFKSLSQFPIALTEMRSTFLCTEVETIQTTANCPNSLYIPGDYCRQGDILVAARKSEKIVFLERGSFLSPRDMTFALDRIDPAKTVLVEAGSFFGYGDTILDVRAFAFYEKYPLLGIALHIGKLSGEAIWRQSPAHFPSWIKETSFDKQWFQVAKTFDISHLIFNRIEDSKKWQKQFHRTLTT